MVVKAGIIISATRADETMTTREKSSGMRHPRSATACRMPGMARSFMVTSAVNSGNSVTNSLNASYPACGVARQSRAAPFSSDACTICSKLV